MQLLREMYKLGQLSAWEAMLPFTKQRLRGAKGSLSRSDCRAFWWVIGKKKQLGGGNSYGNNTTTYFKVIYIYIYVYLPLAPVGLPCRYPLLVLYLTVPISTGVDVRQIHG